MSQTDEIDRGERQPSRKLPWEDAQNELPLCSNRLIIAVEAVRGSGFALELLREHLHLRASARLVFSSYANCYFLQLDEIDRYQNPQVGLLYASSSMPSRTAQIFSQEILTWKPSDIDRVVEGEGRKALIELGLVPPAP